MIEERFFVRLRGGSRTDSGLCAEMAAAGDSKGDPKWGFDALHVFVKASGTAGEFDGLADALRKEEFEARDLFGKPTYRVLKRLGMVSDEFGLGYTRDQLLALAEKLSGREGETVPICKPPSNDAGWNLDLLDAAFPLPPIVR